MKKYLIAAFAAATVSLAGCASMSHDHDQMMMMMMDEKMSDQAMMMEKVVKHLGDLDSKVEANQVMAEQAMMKASMMMKESKDMMDMMHNKNMMK